jgi:nucleotide-binding universal stress UspA family protein
VSPREKAEPPGTGPHSARILVTVAGHSVDEETVRLACRMTRELKQSNVTPRLYVVHVIEVTRALPLSAPVHQQVEQGEQILDNAERIAGEYGLEIQTEMVQARDTGPAIVGEADDWHADVIVMGLPYKRRFGEFNLGKTAPYVLKNAPCQVILFRERLEASQ